jgi:hypothetical protein
LEEGPYSKDVIVSCIKEREREDSKSITIVLDVDQLNQILGILGTPDEETLCRVGSERVRE